MTTVRKLPIGTRFIAPNNPDPRAQPTVVRFSNPCPQSRYKWHINGTDCWDADYPVIVVNQ